MIKAYECPVCMARADLLDVVDLNKSCVEANGEFLPLSGTPIYYALCTECGFCFSPEMCAWSREMFSDIIYNDLYVSVDPDYVTRRPRGNAENLLKMLGERGPSIRHLDYGGGHGLLSDLLRDAGWNSTSYDPFMEGHTETDPEPTRPFDLITAFEVFEHVSDPKDLMRDLTLRIADDGMLLFSTLLSDGEIAKWKRLTWWYASPRNGHISLFSRDSLARLSSKFGFKLHSYSPNFHVCWRNRATWMGALLPADR